MKDPDLIKRMSDTKNENSRLELINLIKDCKIEQTEHDLKIPSHRKKVFISFDEYKQRLINGECPKNISKNVAEEAVNFYNYILKNPNIINKELFEKEYNSGVGLDGISDKYNIPREQVTRLRDFYGIKRKGFTFIKRITKEELLPKEAKDIIIGSMLGDGHIGPNNYFSEKHSEKQVEYLEWKASFLTPILNKNSFRCESYYDKRSGNKIYSFSVRTIVHSDLIEVRKIFYKNDEFGKPVKKIPLNIGELMTPKVFAIWFMDDGNTGWPFKNGIRNSLNASPQCKISSESFTYDENLLLSKVLLDNFGLVANIRFRSFNKKPYLRFDCESSRKLVEMFKKYSTPDLLYKFDEKAYLSQYKKNEQEKDHLLEDFRKRHNIS